jgi:CHAD domain-containing protein
MKQKKVAASEASAETISASSLRSHAHRPANQKSAFRWERVTALARRQMNLLISLEPKVLRGNKPEVIHDLRVASRRLQQILDLLYPKPRSQKIRKLRRTLRRTRDAFSTVRNCDVLLERVERALQRKRTSRREVWMVLRDYLKDLRDARFRKATRKLGSLRLPVFYLQLKSHLEAAPERKPVARRAAPDSNALETAPPDEPFHDRMIQALRPAWAALNERVLQAQTRPTAAALHAVRIGAKKLRYLIEVFREQGVAGSEEAMGCLRQLQQHLGDWHDLEVMEQTLLEMVARPKFLRDHLELALETEKLVLRNRTAKKDYEKKFFVLVQQEPEWARLGNWVEAILGPQEPPGPMGG